MAHQVEITGNTRAYAPFSLQKGKPIPPDKHGLHFPDTGDEWIVLGDLPLPFWKKRGSVDKPLLTIELPTYRSGFLLTTGVLRRMTWQQKENCPTTIFIRCVTLMDTFEGNRQPANSGEPAPISASQSHKLLASFSTLFTQAPLALLYLQGPKFIIELANPLACQLWQRQEADLLGKPLLEALPELKGLGLRERLTHVLTTGFPHVDQELSIHCNRNDKEETVYFKFIYQPIREPDGTMTGVSVVASDVTDEVLERKNIEDKARQTEQILNGIPQMAWTSNPEGIHTFFNQKWYEYTGDSLQTPLAETWQAHMHPEDLEATLAHWHACIRKEEPLHAEYRLRSREDNYRWMLAQALPSRDERGMVTQWIGTCTDIHEKKLASEKVIQQQAQLQALVDNTPDVITRWDASMKLLFANAAFEEKTGMPNSASLGHTNREMGHPEEIATPWMQALERVFQTGQPTEHYDHFPSRNGEKYFYSRLVPEAAPDGSLQSVLATARDITQLKKAEEEIKEQAHFIEQITNATPDLIYLLDIEEVKITYVNNRVQELFGYDPIHIYARGASIFQQALHPKDYERRMAHIKACATLNDHEVKELEVRIKRPNGAWHWFRLRDKVFKRKPDGTVWQTIGIAQDIQDQKEAEEKLKTEHRHLKKAEEIAHIGSFEYRVKKGTMKWSDETYRIFGLSPRDKSITLEKMLEVVHAEDRQTVQKHFRQARKQGRAGELTYQLVCPDGSVRYVNQQVAVSMNSRGEVRKINGTIQDITRRKRAENELEQAFFELDSFVYRASHDIMAPLKSILGLVHLVQMGNNTEDQSKYLSLIGLSVQKLDTFIEDLTNYSRNSRLPILSQPIDFQQLIDDSLQQLAHMPHASRVNVSVDIQQSVPFYSDPSRIKVLLLNFISNAFKYNGSTSRIPACSSASRATRRKPKSCLETMAKAFAKNR